MVGANLVASLERLADIERARKFHETPEEAAAHGFLDSLELQLYWTIRLLIKRHLFVYSPYEVIYCAEELINTMHNSAMQPRVSTPFDLHSLALASMTLLEASVLSDYASECWEYIRKVEEILDRRAKYNAEAGEFEDIFSTPGWDAKIRAFIDWKKSANRTQESSGTDANLRNAAPPMGPTEQRSLQHLADLAVGAEGTVSANTSSPPPVLPPTDNAAGPSGLNATSPNLQPQGRTFVDFTALTKEGYLNVFSGLIYRRLR